MKFTDFLVKRNLISKDDMDEVVRKSYDSGQNLERVLAEKGISPEDIVSAKAEALGIPYRVLAEKRVPFEILKLIPEESARQYQMVPIGMDEENNLEVGMLNPENIEAKEALQFISTSTNAPFKVFLISTTDFERVLNEYKSLSGEVTKVLGELESDLSEMLNQGPGIGEDMSLKNKFVEDAPITKMVAVVLKHAISGNASDIHIEPTREKLKVRFRVDGILYTSLLLPMSVHEALVSRIKILTNMKLDEKRKPQDGRFSARIDNKDIDFRVSSLPTFFGEKMAIRILDTQKGAISLDELGFSTDNIEAIKEAITHPFGLILLTGPTGSGKTTTLYAMLQELDREKNNIVSLEDPVEYSISGVNQSQVRPEIGYDFANGLRTILRQDPNIILVGEIRDKETAALAIQSALTGHLVLSTLHTNSAAGVIPRLIDMGVDPYLIAPTLIMAIGQRLVGKLCTESRGELPVSGDLKKKLEEEYETLPDFYKKKMKIPEKVYEPKMSAACPKGSRGRVAVAEILRITPEIKRMVAQKPTEQAIAEEARKEGMLNIKNDALIKIFEGVIGVESLASV